MSGVVAILMSGDVVLMNRDVAIFIIILVFIMFYFRVKDFIEQAFFDF